MSYLISQLKDDLERKMHGTTLSQIASPYDLIYEAARNLIAKIDPKETVRVSQITNGVYNKVYSYILPSDIKGNKILSILPQAQVGPRDNMAQIYNEQFDLYKNREGGNLNVEFNSGIKTLNLSVKNNKAGKTLNSANSITDNGTWSAGGNASNLFSDNLTKFSGSSSLRFDLAGGGSQGTLTNSTMTAIDCSDEEKVGAIFIPVYIPTPGAVTSIALNFGNDASNYWTNTVTAASDATEFKTGWNLLRFNWDSATKTGTVNATTIDYLKVDVNYNGTEILNFRVDNIVLRLGQIYDLKYYSKFLFRSTAGIWKEAPTEDTDTVNLDTDSYNILLYEVAFLATQEIQGSDGVFDRNYWDVKLAQEYKNYTDNYKSEAIRPQGTYYRQPNTRRGGNGIIRN